MSEHTRKYFTCDICRVEMAKPYRGGESGTYEMIATENYAVAGGYAINWRDLCQPCNNFLKGAISDLKRLGDEIRKARQGADQVADPLPEVCGERKRQVTTDLIERAKAALRLLPVATHDTQDYCEATGPCFQAMTMDREAFEALNLLPDLIAEVEATTTSAEKAETRVAKLAAVMASVYDTTEAMKPCANETEIGVIQGMCSAALKEKADD